MHYCKYCKLYVYEYLFVYCLAYSTWSDRLFLLHVSPLGLNSLSILLQTISVSVSVLTLSCIAQDRWYAICHPLKFKSTAKRARKSIVLIWLVSCVIMIPQAIVMECSSLLPEFTNKTSLFTVCDEEWGGKRFLHNCTSLKQDTVELLYSARKAI